MLYQLVLTYENNVVKRETGDLPTLMHCLSYYMDNEPWRLIEITNCQTGELIACWTDNPEYGVTTAS